MCAGGQAAILSPRRALADGGVAWYRESADKLPQEPPAPRTGAREPVEQSRAEDAPASADAISREEASDGPDAGAGRGAGRAQEDGDRVCARAGRARRAPAGGADLRYDGPGVARAARVAGGAGRDPRRDGGHGRLLEAGVLHPPKGGAARSGPTP